MKKKKVKKEFKEMYTPTLTYDIRWIQMYLREKYAKLYSAKVPSEPGQEDTLTK